MYRCNCLPGWEGFNCDKETKPACDSSPCKNNGKCLKDYADRTRYVCHCQYPYSGDNCELIIDPCWSNPCENSGTCLPLSDKLYRQFYESFQLFSINVVFVVYNCLFFMNANAKRNHLLDYTARFHTTKINHYHNISGQLYSLLLRGSVVLYFLEVDRI